MPNRSYLVGTNSSNAGDGYDADQDVLAAATSVIPLLWFSIFDESDVQYVSEGDRRMPSLVTSTEVALRRLKERQPAIKRALPDNVKQFTAWKKLIAKAPHKFIKVDGSEVWSLSPEEYESSLLPAVRWFSSNDADDLKALESLSQTQSETVRRSIRFPWHSKHDLHGVQWVREVPWDEENDEQPPARHSTSAPVPTMLESIAPEALKKYPLLHEFWDNHWLSRCGQPLPPEVSPGLHRDLVNALFATRSWAWPKSLIVMQKWFTWITENLAIDPAAYYRERRAELEPVVSKIYFQRFEPKLPRETEKYKLDGLGSAVYSDMIHLILERELGAKGMQSDLFARVWSVYQSGHLPYGWEGESPERRVLAY